MIRSPTSTLNLASGGNFLSTNSNDIKGAVNVLADIGGGYVPAQGDTFNDLAATGGVLGSFDPLVHPVRHFRPSRGAVS